jgi:hypothetical protein
MKSTANITRRKSPPQQIIAKDGSTISNLKSRAKQTYLKIFNKDRNSTAMEKIVEPGSKD